MVAQTQDSQARREGLASRDSYPKLTLESASISDPVGFFNRLVHVTHHPLQALSPK
jgi:hypothetical protein